jgi:hypothetical protein
VKLGHDNNHLYNVFMEGIVTGEDQRCLLSVVDISMLLFLPNFHYWHQFSLAPPFNQLFA